MTTAKYNIVTVENDRKVVYEFDCEGRTGYEIKLLENLTDEEVCRLYRVDSRREAIEGIIEYWKYIA